MNYLLFLQAFYSLIASALSGSNASGIMCHVMAEAVGTRDRVGTWAIVGALFMFLSTMKAHG